MKVFLMLYGLITALLLVSNDNPVSFKYFVIMALSYLVYHQKETK